MNFLTAVFFSVVLGFVYTSSLRQAVLYNPALATMLSSMRIGLCVLFFFYLLHLPLIHFILTLLTFMITVWSLLLRSV